MTEPSRASASWPPRSPWRRTLSYILLAYGVAASGVAIVVAYAGISLIQSAGGLLAQHGGSTGFDGGHIRLMIVPVLMVCGVVGVARYEVLAGSAKPVSALYETVQFVFGLVWFSALLATAVYDRQ